MLSGVVLHALLSGTAGGERADRDAMETIKPLACVDRHYAILTSCYEVGRGYLCLALGRWNPL